MREALTDAIRNGDSRLASMIQREHREKANEALIGVLDEYQLLHL